MRGPRRRGRPGQPPVCAARGGGVERGAQRHRGVGVAQLWFLPEDAAHGRLHARHAARAAGEEHPGQFAAVEAGAQEHAFAGHLRLGDEAGDLHREPRWRRILSLQGVTAALARAKATADVLLARLKLRGLPVRARVDLIGVASVHDSDDGALWRAYEGPEPPDIRIRLAAEGATRDDVDQAAREVLAQR